MVPSHTIGELQLTTEVRTVFSPTVFSPNRICASLTVSSARSGAVTMPMKGLSEYLMWRIDDVEMALRHRHVHRLADHAAGMVQLRRHVGELDEILQVFQRAVAALVLEVAHEGRAVGRREHGVAPADHDVALGIARMLPYIAPARS